MTLKVIPEEFHYKESHMVMRDAGKSLGQSHQLLDRPGLRTFRQWAWKGSQDYACTCAETAGGLPFLEPVTDPSAHAQRQGLAPGREAGWRMVHVHRERGLTSLPRVSLSFCTYAVDAG